MKRYKKTQHKQYKTVNTIIYITKTPTRTHNHSTRYTQTNYSQYNQVSLSIRSS